MSDVLIKLRAFYENAETDESLYDIRRAIEELERLYALFDGPPTWQEEAAEVEDAFDRSGVKPTWPDDEPGNIGPMAAAMEAEIARLRLTEEEREAVKLATDFLEDEFYGCSDKCAAEHNAVATLRKLLARLA